MLSRQSNYTKPSAIIETLLEGQKLESLEMGIDILKGERLSQTHILIGQEVKHGSSCSIRPNTMLRLTDTIQEQTMGIFGSSFFS